MILAAAVTAARSAGRQAAYTLGQGCRPGACRFPLCWCPQLLVARTQPVSRDSFVLQEVRYNADFQLLQMERRLARAEGHRSRDETAALTARIAQLERELGAAAAEHGMLSEELKRTEDDHGGWAGMPGLPAGWRAVHARS